MSRILTLLLPLLLLPLLMTAQCLKGDCSNGSGTFQYRSGSKYVGQFKSGKRHGIGSLFYADGSKYQGQWLHDQPHGEGQETLPDGSIQEGIWKNGRLVRKVALRKQEPETVAKGSKKQIGCISGDCNSGKGIYIYPSGAVYIGEFRNGEIHGYGTCYYADGSKYKGNWAHRYPDGKGVKTFANGTIRDGYWKKGQPVDEFGNFDDVIEHVVSSGDGSDGTDIQSGCISGNCQSGKGIYAYPDGSRYEGQFADGKPHETGTFYYQNGDKYVGNFRLGQPDGKGRMFYRDGRTLHGLWKNGEYFGKPTNNDGPGCIVGNCKHGYGTYLFEDGTKYEGRFLEGYPHGNGIVTYTNGERYEGEMANGSFEGYGTLDLVNGTQVTGYWSNGKFVGKQKVVAKKQTREMARPNTLPDQPDIQVWAVIIGVASYDHMPALRYTDDDAYRMYAFFKSPEGGALDDDHIKILIDEDATRERIMNTMNEVFGKAGENDLIMLYFSGHGLKGSFLPIDFDGFNNKIYHEEINRILRNSKAKLKLCIADACHSGSLLAGRGDEIPETLQTFYKSLAQAGPGSALLMSSKSDETSLESKGLRQGVFSHFLIRGLKGEADSNKDALVSIQELYNYIFFNVRAYTGKRQSPLIQGNYDKNMAIAIRRY